MFRKRPSGTKVAACLASLLVALPGTAAAQRVISNMATIGWDSSSGRVERTSNRVDVIVEALPGGLLSFAAPAPGSIPSDVLLSACGSASSTPPVSWAPPANSAVTEIAAGRPIVLSIALSSANVNPNTAETMTAVVTTSSGDRETLRFTETAPDSGIFVAAVQTRSAPNPVAADDCRLAVQPGTPLQVTIARPAGGSVANGTIAILVNTANISFDSRNGNSVAGVRITLVDASGQPAQVFGDDGVSAFPSTLVTGQAVTDSGGATYSFGPGEFRFPTVSPGNYRLIVEPTAPYNFPSTASADALAQLSRPDGTPFLINGASVGGALVLTATGAFLADVPLDRPLGTVTLTKSASRAEATVGDVIQYAITIQNGDSSAPSGFVSLKDLLPEQLRYRPGSARLDKVRVPDPVVIDGRELTFSLSGLTAGAGSRLTYLAEVRPDARAGDAINRVTAFSTGGESNTADAIVRIRRDLISERLTVLGRLLIGDCTGTTTALPNVRVMLEDGSYAVSDIEGRFHFEGVTTGSHVVAVDRSTVPQGLEAVDCARDTRSGGSATSRLVDGSGGQLKSVVFTFKGQAATTQEPTGAAEVRVAARSDAEAAGAETNWLEGQAPGIEWLFPKADHNPRAPVVRVAIKHAPGQSVALSVDGRPVDPTAFDGTQKNDLGVAVSQWRGIPLESRTSHLRAIVRDARGATVQVLKRDIVFANEATRAILEPGQSQLVADGVRRPVIAVRLLDRDGRPARHGLVGDLQLSAPYFAAMEATAQQMRQLSGLERAQPVWKVEGDQGLALIELEPTTVSGTVVLTFRFRDGDRVREQRVEAWLDPGDRPWTVVGLAEGSVGFNRIDKKMERLTATGADEIDGRLALYAKGRVKGRWLLTLAYDSDKKRADSRINGVIDPQDYYTVYANRSERRFDAASVRKLYIKLERPQFAALFGDFETAIDEPQLARYVRTLNGVKAAYRSRQVAATAFAADEPLTHGRDEIQGNGLSGPYALRNRDIVANSERITIEVRDRFRSERIVEQRVLTRYTDYVIDYRAGTVRFREPILSRDSALNPQFIVADYEAEGSAKRRLSAGGRVAWRTKDDRFQLAATAIRDAGQNQTGTLGGVDLRIRPDLATEVRAEAALSHNKTDEGSTTSRAWLIEVERHDGKLDLLAYARERQSGFGVGQLNRAESGTFKMGADARLRINERLSLSASAWRDDYLNSMARRTAARGLLEYKGQTLTSRAGLIFANDRLQDGLEEQSTLAELGATARFLGNRLEVDASTQMPIGGADASIDFPARHRLSGRFAVVRDIALVASYEIASGEGIDARTTRLGFDVAPWAGARIAIAGNLQDIGELGTRTFAAFGLSQSVTVGKAWTLDVAADGNRTLGGVDSSRVLNSDHPIASGGFIGDGSLLSEDFIALSAGATYRADDWTITGRGELREGDVDDRIGLILGAIRQIGNGRALGGGIEWYKATSPAGARTEVGSARLSWAHRPEASLFHFLDKLEVRLDRVRGGIAGEPGPLGSGLLVDGNAKSVRIINNFAATLHRQDNRAELGIYWGARYASDRLGPHDIKGLSNLVAVDGRLSLGDLFEVGASASVRHGLGGRAIAWSFGPQVGYSPAKGSLLTVGYNFAGYEDRDFADERTTRSGAYASIRIKFDELSLASLGLGRR